MPEWSQFLFDLLVLVLGGATSWLVLEISNLRKQLQTLDKQVAVLETLKIDPIEYAKLVTSLTQAVSSLTTEVARKSEALNDLERTMRDIQNRLAHLETLIERMSKRENA